MPDPSPDTPHSPIVIYGRGGAWAWCPCGWSTFSWQHQVTSKRLEAHRTTMSASISERTAI